MSAIFTKRFLLILIAVILITALFYFILPVSVPLIVAFITALILEPVVKLLQNKIKINRRVSVLITFLGFVLFIGLSGYFITTKVITEAIKLVENAPMYINEITKAWLRAEADFSNAAKDLPKDLVDEISNQIQSFLNKTKNDLVAYVNIDSLKALLTNIPNYLVSFIVYLIALFLFLIDLPRLRKGLYNHLTEKTADKVKFMTSRLSYVGFGFFKAQFLVSVIIFIVSLIGLLFINPEMALIMSIIIWIIDFIPIIGSIVILGPWALFHLLTGDLAMGTQLAILAAVLLIIRRTVEPKVMGTHIGLSPLATLIAMYLGLKLIGILGFIIGPLLVIAFNSAKEAGLIKMNFKI
ncbi:sporulation integral membrane protein YtvI [Cytobacillus firmus]|uniref:sporulation integral membrane protein YtvI n=1 Tax=Cytobacillus TaxID=2675230 RepID=UPI002162AC28|nr:sporulation integral membrane protein YtvI [Cytobacillus firmus]MCS0672933.1 sporulation integral membrane protein YtvI [Cytobacillus firmus]MCS0787361.1 sporulation integral membrane protein YtvI [Cytobacillus firmus]